MPNNERTSGKFMDIVEEHLEEIQRDGQKGS